MSRHYRRQLGFSLTFRGAGNVALDPSRNLTMSFMTPLWVNDFMGKLMGLLQLHTLPAQPLRIINRAKHPMISGILSAKQCIFLNFNILLVVARSFFALF